MSEIAAVREKITSLQRDINSLRDALYLLNSIVDALDKLYIEISRNGDLAGAMKLSTLLDAINTSDLRLVESTVTCMIANIDGKALLDIAFTTNTKEVVAEALNAASLIRRIQIDLMKVVCSGRYK